MKNSKFLKSSKDMLSRSFNPAKCKTSLRLAGSRLKLLRNKKEVQVKQMKREIAQLLESGQDQTARIRVEHVIREDKMMAACDLIQIYCELIVARLPIIESQKNCPIDLKEAITSVIFASPRCGDVPELLDIRKHFAAKYGKDFTTAAIELRPHCGVGRMLVEKLSAGQPDLQTKINFLSAIAEEHNIKWDHKPLEEKDSVPPSDLLTGPSTFGKESKPSVDPPHFEAPAVQASQSSNKLNGSPLNFSQQDHKNSPGTEKLASAQPSSVSTTFQPDTKPPGGEKTHLFHGQRWNMEFKDATSAAHAAAESAEMASIAARAAADLSRQHSSEYHKSEVYNFKKDEGLETYVNPKLACDRFSQESGNRSSSEHSRSKNEQIDEIKPNDLKTADGQSSSLESEASTDAYSRENSLKEVSRGEVRMNKEKSEKFREERAGKQPSVNSPSSRSSISEDVNIFSISEDQKYGCEDPFLDVGKEGAHGEASHASSNESAAVSFDKYDSDSEVNGGFDIDPTYDEHESEYNWPSSRQKSPEHLPINTDSWSPISSSSKIVKPTSPLPFVTGKNSSLDFAEKDNNTMAVIFDDSDGPSSESDEDMSMLSRHSRMDDSTNLPSKYNQSGKSVGSPLKEQGSSGFDRKKQLSISSNDELQPKETHRERNQGKKFDTGNESHTESEEGLNLGKLTGGLRHKGYKHPPYSNKGTVGTTATIKSSTAPPLAAESPSMSTMVESKKTTRTPDHQSESDSDSSEEEEYLRKSLGQKQKKYTLGTGKEVRTKPKIRASNSVFGSDSSDLDEDPPKESLPKKSHMQSGISRRTKASPSSGTNSYSKTRLKSESLDFDDNSETPKKSEVKSPSSLGTNSYSKTRLKSESLDFDDISKTPKKSEVKSPSPGTNSYSKTRVKSESLDFDDTSKTPKKSESQRNSIKLENQKPPASGKLDSKPAKSNYWGPPEPYNSTISTSESKARLRSETHDSDVSVKRKPTKSSQSGNSEKPTSLKVASSKTSSSSSGVEEPLSAQPKTEASPSNSEIPKAAALNKIPSNKEDSTKKASHVHPKLPDYDTLFQSLRMNRS